MPIYEYRCKECQQVFEEWCKHVEEGQVQQACPICKGQAERLISQTTFALKGGGWYVTEYGSRKSDSSANKESSPTGTESSAGAAAPAPAGASCAAPTGS